MEGEEISKFKTKLYKYFGECNKIENIEDLKVPFIMSHDNVIGIEIKSDILKKELLPFFNSSTTNNINLSFMDEQGSFVNIKLLKYCIDLINIFQNHKSNNVKEKAIFINSGHNKPIVLENGYIKIYLCNMHSEEWF